MSFKGSAGEPGDDTVPGSSINDFVTEYAKSNRSTCRGCEDKIDKVYVDCVSGFLFQRSDHGSCHSPCFSFHTTCDILIQDLVRISKKDYESQRAKMYGPQDQWYHVDCFVKERDDLGFGPLMSTEK